MYGKRVKKPIENTSSEAFADNIGKIKTLYAPILDLACGYGRNGLFLAKQGHNVIFADNDQDCLDYIDSDEFTDDENIRKHIRTLKYNFGFDTLPFPDNSLGGIIDVHFYNPLLIKEFKRVIKPGGFIYFETISAKQGNIVGLPEYGYVLHELSGFTSIFYKERLLINSDFGNSTMKLLAVKDM